MARTSSVFKILLIVTVPLALAAITFFILDSALRAPADPNNKTEALIEVSPGMNFREICKLLESKGIIKHARSLDLLARFKGTNTRTINAGEYPLAPSMSPEEILKRLASGEVKKRRITVKEGMSIWDIGRVIDEAGLMVKDEFDRAMTDPHMLVDAHILSSSFEGYLFPETYEFSRPVSAKQIIWRMMEEGEKYWPVQFSDQADKLKLTRHDILTLASIIEKESGNAAEQPIISSVFHNRLNQGMKLQSDPTVIYGITNFNGNLTRENLEDPNNRYNTYVYFGLPPGPIANPGASSIKAALFPAETTFLFFVADGQGSHVFSSTLKEHNENVDRYQRHRAAADKVATDKAAEKIDSKPAESPVNKAPASANGKGAEIPTSKASNGTGTKHPSN